MRVFRAGLALALVVALTGSAWATCVSGALAPDDTTCVTSSHDCPLMDAKDLAATACCRSSQAAPDRIHLAAVKPGVDSPVALTGPSALVPEPQVRLSEAAVASFGSETLKLPDRPAYLVFATLLI
jgi:hypothetical protein